MTISPSHGTSNRISTGSVSSMTLSISSSPGDLIVVLGYPSGGSSSTPVSSVTDSGGNTWAIPGGYPSSSPPAAYTGGIGCFLAYCNVAHSLSSVTVNVPTCSELTVDISVYTGVKTSFPLRQGTGVIASSVSLNALGGNLTVAGANTSNATSISGESVLMIDRGNLAGFGLPGYNHTVTMGWSPTQNGAAVMAEFEAQTAVTINGTATLSDSESVTAHSGISAIATITDSESMTAVSGTNPHVAFSAVTPDQNDANGIPLIHGLTTYHYASTTATTYDYWMSLQDGQLGAGLYNAARNSGLTVSSSVPKWTDSGSNTLGMVRAYSKRSTSALGSFTTETAVPGASITIVVTGSNATLQVVTTFDMNAGTSACTLVGLFRWNGTDQSAQAIFVATAQNQRYTVGQTYTITGIAAGSYTAALYATCTNNGANNGPQSPHTGFNALLIDM